MDGLNSVARSIPPLLFMETGRLINGLATSTPFHHASAPPARDIFRVPSNTVLILHASARCEVSAHEMDVFIV